MKTTVTKNQKYSYLHLLAIVFLFFASGFNQLYAQVESTNFDDIDSWLNTNFGNSFYGEDISDFTEGAIQTLTLSTRYDGWEFELLGETGSDPQTGDQFEFHSLSNLQNPFGGNDALLAIVYFAGVDAGRIRELRFRSDNEPFDLESLEIGYVIGDMTGGASVSSESAQAIYIRGFRNGTQEHVQEVSGSVTMSGWNNTEDFESNVVSPTGFTDIDEVRIEVVPTGGSNSSSNFTDYIAIRNIQASASASQPSVTTNPPSHIQSTTAQVNGNVTDDGGATITQRGFAYGTSANPVIGDNNAPVTGTTGAFNTILFGLNPGTLYYVRAYAQNSEGLTYGTQQTFTTLTTPTVSTSSPGSFTLTSANVGGNVTANGGAAVTERGIAWDTSPNPDIDDNKFIIGSGTGSFNNELSGLSSGETYYVRAYATNSVGTSYGTEQSFTTNVEVTSIERFDPASAITNSNQVTFRINFSGPVSGLSSANFSVGTTGISGASWGGITGSGSTYYVTYNTGTGDGTIRLDYVNNNGVTPSVQGVPFTGGQSYTIDKTPPTVTSITAQQSSPTNETDLEFELEFSEDVQEPVAGDFNITNGSFDGVTGSGDTWTLTVNPDDPNSEVTITVEVLLGEIQDLAGNTLGNSDSESIDYDGVVPQITSVDAVETGTTDNITGPTNETTFDIRVVFSEDVENLDLSELTITPTDIFDSNDIVINDNVMTIPVEIPSADQQDLVEIEITFASGLVTDEAGNEYAGGDDFDITYDGRRPSVDSFDGPDRDATNEDPFEVTLNFSENVQLENGGLIQVTNGTLLNVTPDSSPSDEIVLQIEPTLQDDPGENNFDISITIGEGAFLSQSMGNPNDESSTYTVTFDDRPLEITEFTATVDEGITNAENFDITITFNKPVFDFDFGDINITGNADVTYSGNTFDDDESSFTFTVTHVEDGSLDFTIPTDVAEDAAGNQNNNTAELSFVLDRTAPTFADARFLDPSDDSEIDSPTNLYQFELEIEFSEDLDGAAIDLNNLNITSSNPEVGTDIVESAVVSNEMLTLEFLIPAGERDEITDFEFTISTGFVADLAGNEFAGSETFSITYNGTRPTVTVTSTVEATNAGPIPITIQFSEEVTDFVAGDISVDNGSVDAGSFSDEGGGEFTIDINPDNTDPGENYDITINIPENVAEDLAGNLNQASTEDLVITFDTTPFTVAFSSNEEDFTNEASFDVTITFNKAAPDFVMGDIDEGNATLSNLTPNAEEDEFTVTVTPVSEGEVTLDIAAGATEDAAGNENEVADQFSIIFDETRPDPVISTTAPVHTNSSPIPLSIDFGEEIVEFTQAMAEATVSAEDGTSFDIEDFTNVDGDSQEFTFNLIPDGDDVFTIQLAENVAEDLAGNQSEESNEIVVSYNTSRPEITFRAVEDGGSITDDELEDPTNAEFFTLFMDFGEELQSFVVGDINEDVGTDVTLTDFTPVNSSEGIYSVRVQPNEDGQIIIEVADGAVQNLAGNDNEPGSFDIKSDRTAPTIASIQRSGGLEDPTNESPFDIIIIFSEEIVDFDESDLSVTNATATDFSTTDNVAFTVTVEPDDVTTSSNSIEVGVPAGAFTDLAGNENEADEEDFTIEFGDTRPTAELTTLENDPTNADEFDVTLDITEIFGEPVSPININDFTIGGADISSFSINDVNNPQFVITIEPLEEGEISIQLNDNVLTDVAGNLNEASNVFTITYDTSPPQVSISSDEDDPTNADDFEVTITFNKPVFNFEQNDIVAGNAQLSGFIGNDGDTEYTVTVAPDGDGQVTIDVPQGSAQDAADNDNEESDTFEIESDRTAPTITSIERATGLADPTNESEFDIIITFSEEIADFDESELDVANATATEFTSNVGNTEFTVTLEADPVTTSSSTIEIGVPAGAFTDLAGNENVADDEDFTIEFGDTRPTAEFTTTANNPTFESPIPITLTITEIFGEDVTGFDVNDIQVNQHVDELTFVSQTGNVIELEVTPDGDGPFDLELTLAENAVTDVAGNENEQSPTFSITFDNNAPTVAITADNANEHDGDLYTNTDPVPVTITFSKPVWGFELTDVDVTNATVDNFSGNDGDTEFTLDIIPPPGSGPEVITLDVPADVAQDEAGKDNEAATQFSITWDQNRPEVTSITLRDPGTQDPLSDYTNLTDIEAVIVFDKEITDFDLSELDIEHATTNGFSSPDNIEFVVEISADGVTTSVNTISVDVPEDAFTDKAGNTNEAAGDAGEVAFSNIRPTAVLSSGITDPTSLDEFEVTLNVSETFGEPVTNITAGDFSITRAQITNIDDTDNPEFVLTIEPLEEGGISIQLNENVLEDVAGNQNEASNEFTITYDISPPQVTISTDETDPTNADDFEVTITFNKPVWNFEQNDIVAGNAQLSGFTGNDGDTDYTVTVAPDGDGQVTIDVPQASAQDEADNDNVESDTFEITSDRTAPTVVSVEAASGTDDPTSDTPFDVLITFSEELASLDQNALIVSNADIDEVTTADNIIFTVSLIPDADGVVSLEVPAEAGEDLAGNLSLAADDDFSITYFGTPSQVVLLSPEDGVIDVSILPELVWESVSRAQTYEMQVSRNEDFTDIEHDIEDITETSYTLTQELDYDQTWYWRVRGNNEGFTGEWSDAYSFTTVPEPPPAVTLASPSNNAIDVVLQPELTWNSADRAVSYQLQATTGEDFSNPEIDETELTGTAYEVEEDLLQEQAYRWRVRAENPGGIGQWSDAWMFTTRPAPPSRVIVSAPMDSAGTVSITPELSWQQADRANVYHVEVAEDESFSNPLQTMEDLTETSLQLDEDLEYYGVYHWRVRAENSGGQGEWSETEVFITEAEMPVIQFPMDQSTGISIAPQFSWSSPYQESMFELRVSTSPDMTESLEEHETTIEGYQAEGLLGSTGYYWQVRVADRLTSSEWTEPQTFNTRSNPATEEFAVTLTFETSHTHRIESEDYRMVALPGNEQIALNEVLGAEYGQQWRAFADMGFDTDYLNEYDPESNNLLFQPGQGFWVFHRDSIEFEMEIEPVVVDEADSYGIDIHPGWNIIANPYTVPVAWNEILEFNEIDGPLYEYNQLFNDADSLRPFIGYYFYNDPQWDLDQLDIPYVELEGRRSQQQVQSVMLSQQGEVEASGRIELQAGFGDGSDEKIASTEVVWDYSTGFTDSPYPSLKMSRYGVAFTAEEGNGFYRNIGAHYNEIGTEYDLKIKSPVGKTLKWEADISGLSDHARVLLINPVTFSSYILADGDVEEIKVTEPEISWQVYVGDEAYLREIQDNLIPDQITLMSNYPNPFNPNTNIVYALTEELDVRLEVYDVLGRRVSTLVQSRQPKGWYTVTFEAQNLASGVYFYRLVAGQTILTEKMMLIK